MSELEAVSVVAVGPHPDDVELFCGGTVATLVAAGQRVAILDLTQGERATRGDLDTRAREASRAAEILGVARTNLRLPDGAIDPFGGDASPASTVGRVVAALRSLRPRVVLLPHRHARHPDHAAASALVRRAVFLAGLQRVEGGAPHRVMATAEYFLRVASRPSFVVDVSAAYETKRSAIAAYQSQVQPRSDGTLVGAPGAREALEARDAYFGSLIGAARGEGFYTESMIGTQDPVALLATPSGAPRLFWEGSP